MKAMRIKDEFEGQPRFDFPESDDGADDISALSLMDRLKEIYALVDHLAEERTQFLTAHGVKIFPITTINDRESVEADYGAPSIGLNLFQDVIDPTRAFRYEPVENVEGGYNTHTNQSRAIGRALKAQGYKIFNGLTEDQYPSQIHFTNGGVTRAFSDIVHDIVQKFEDIQEVKRLYSVEQAGGAIFVPVPTYGLFLSHLDDILEGKDIKVVPVRRNDDGSVNVLSLRMKIEDCQADNIRIIGYYDCNPNNPTGHIRTRLETEEIGKILIDTSMDQIKRDIEFFSPLLEDALDKMNDETSEEDARRQDLHRCLGYISDRPHGSIVIIDDMAYEGLELKTNVRPYSFAQVSRMVAERTVTLKGISKIGMPGMRIGLAIGHHEILSTLAGKQLFNEFSANSLGVDVLAARYGSPRRRQLFLNHQRKLARQHKERALFLQAFFKGLNNVPELSQTQKQKLISKYAHYLDISPKQSQEQLEKGLPNLHISDVPECGFFQTINCEALKGHAIAVKVDDQKMPVYQGIFSSNMLYCVFKAFGIHTVPASWQGLPTRSLMARVTYSMPESDFYNFFDRISKMHDYFWGKNPEAQLDLFRSTQFQPTLK